MVGLDDSPNVNIGVVTETLKCRFILLFVFFYWLTYPLLFFPHFLCYRNFHLFIFFRSSSFLLSYYNWNWIEIDDVVNELVHFLSHHGEKLTHVQFPLKFSLANADAVTNFISRVIRK